MPTAMQLRPGDLSDSGGPILALQWTKVSCRLTRKKIFAVRSSRSGTKGTTDWSGRESDAASDAALVGDATLGRHVSVADLTGGRSRADTAPVCLQPPVSPRPRQTPGERMGTRAAG